MSYAFSPLFIFLRVLSEPLESAFASRFFFAHFMCKNMLLTRLRRATPFVVTGLVGSAALYGYKARFLEQGRKRELLYFGMFCMSRS